MNAQQVPPPVLQRVAGRVGCRPWDAAVVIPARDEVNRIEDCLHALADAIDHHADASAKAAVPPERCGAVGTIVCVNDTTDDTAVRAVAVLRARAVPHLVLDLRFVPGSGGVGRVRDIGMTLSQRIAQPPQILMTTDADSRVCPGWVAANIAELRRAEVVFGTIMPDADELARILPHLPAHGPAEEAYTQAANRLVTLLDPLAHDPAPRHRNHSGASIALTAQALARIGGIPWQPLSEDRALARRAEALDLRIRHASSARVVTSCRLDGRAAGGMATTLRERCSQADPLCDAWLEPADALVRRYAARGRLRALWPSRAAVWSMVHRSLGPAPAGWPHPLLHPIPLPQDFDTFGAYWQRLEAVHPALSRQRLRQSEAARELPLLLARLRQIKGAGLRRRTDTAHQDLSHALPAQ